MLPPREMPAPRTCTVGKGRRQSVDAAKKLIPHHLPLFIPPILQAGKQGRRITYALFSPIKMDAAEECLCGIPGGTKLSTVFHISKDNKIDVETRVRHNFNVVSTAENVKKHVVINDQGLATVEVHLDTAYGERIRTMYAHHCDRSACRQLALHDLLGCSDDDDQTSPTHTLLLTKVIKANSELCETDDTGTDTD